MKKIFFVFLLTIFNSVFCDWQSSNVDVSTYTSGSSIIVPQVALNSSGYAVAVWGTGVSVPFQVEASISRDF